MRVFVSQPMTGRTGYEIREERNACLEYAESLYGPCEEVRSYFGETGRSQMKPLEGLGKSIELMAHADVVIFAPDWGRARGCRIEHACAVAYGLDVIEM